MEDNFRILKPYLRGFPLIVLAMVITVMAAKKYLSYVTPMYESTVKLKLADVNEGVPSSNLFKDLDVFATANKIAAEIEVIKSNMMINAVLDSLDFDLEVYRIGKVRKVELYHESPFIITANFTSPKAFDKRFSLQVISDKKYSITLPDSDKPKEGMFGEILSSSLGQLLIALDNDVIARKQDFSLVDNYEFEFLSREKLTRKISSNLDVVAIDKDVAVVRINIKNAIPEKASGFVNQLAKSYINDYIETKYKAAQTTVKFLEDRINNISKKLATSETTIQRFRDNRDIINIHQETETDLRKISQLKIQHANLKMNLDAIADLHKYVQNGKNNFLDLAPNFEAFTDLLSTEIIKKIKQLQAEKKDLLITFTPEDERVQVVDLKIQDLTSYLVESISNTHKNIQVKYDRLSAEIAEAEKVFIGVPEKERMLTILNREFEIYQRSYNFLNEKKIEAEIAQAAKIAFHRIISPAEPSKVPVSPNRPIIIIVSALVAMFGALGFIFIVHTLKAKVNDAYTIEHNSSIPIALQTPFLYNENDKQHHFLKEAIQLELKGIIRDKDIVTITSANSREGASFHVFNLAVALARQQRRVLVVDVSRTLSFLSANEHKNNTPESTSFANISYMDFSSPAHTLLTKPLMEELLNGYKKIYDLLIINNESLSDETIGLMLMSVAQSNLFVVDSRKTAAAEIIRIATLQQEFNLAGMWFVLNRAGYNPNVVKEIIRWGGIQFKKFQQRQKS
jgi:uncharacterized protein involved in exopolysaccharide biosynthesis